MEEETLDDAIDALVEYVQSPTFNADRLEKYERAVFEAVMEERCPLYFAFVNQRL